MASDRRGDVAGDFVATDICGDVTLGRVSGKVKVATQWGEIRVVSAGKGADLSSAGGGVRADVVTGDLVAASPFTPSEPLRRVTVGRSLNMSPTFSPDGRRIAYTSDRLCHPEVYISDADGTNPELLTPFNYGDQSHRTNPDWSPDGRLIAFQSQIDGRFQIMTINPRDRVPRRHTSEGQNEDPSWAPDSRHLVFMSNRSGSRQLWVLDTESGRDRQLTRMADVPSLSAAP